MNSVNSCTGRRWDSGTCVDIARDGARHIGNFAARVNHAYDIVTAICDVDIAEYIHRDGAGDREQRSRRYSSIATKTAMRSSVVANYVRNKSRRDCCVRIGARTRKWH